MTNTFSYRVYYEDTDEGGVVYYANYLKFCERARTDFLRDLGIVQSELAEKHSLRFVVKRATIDYVSPAKLDDLVDVSVVIKNLGGASVLMEQEITKNGMLVATLAVEIVTIDAASFKVKRIPQEIREILTK